MPTTECVSGERAVMIAEVLGSNHGYAVWARLGTPHTPLEISGEHDIPRATAYRRIRELRHIGLVTVEGTVQSSAGPSPSKYRRLHADVTMTTDPHNNFVVELTKRPGLEARDALSSA